MKSLKENDVWELMELPKGRKIVESKWVYKLKTGADGSIDCYKARLVAQGFMQKYDTLIQEEIYFSLDCMLTILLWQVKSLR